MTAVPHHVVYDQVTTTVLAGATSRVSDQGKRNRIGARVRLHLDGEERTTRVVIREDRKPGVVAAPIILR